MKKSILVIEDNDAIIEEITDIFEMEGFNVLTAKNGEDGIRIAKQSIPDLIVSDVLMPKKNGYQVLTELLKEPETSVIPFIFLSAKAEMSDIREGMNLGADDYIIKPISPDDLMIAVNTKLKKKELYNKREIYFKEQTKNLNKNFEAFKNKNADITDNLDYAKQIQESILNFSQFDKFPSCIDSFVLFLPKESLSGDFYWSHNKLSEIYIAAADCTGHGISASLLSVLGVTFLNQIVIQENISDPSEILTKLKDKMINAIHTEQTISSGNGMDIALIKINWKLLKLEYAGANSPLWITRSKNNKIEKSPDYLFFEKDENILVEIQPTKIPIGEHPSNENTFKTKAFDLIPGDMIYLFSDGYPHQFGGKENKRFMSKNLKSYLLDINKLPMSEQKEKLKSTFYNWKGNQDQTDDVLVIGLNIK